MVENGLLMGNSKYVNQLTLYFINHKSASEGSKKLKVALHTAGTSLSMCKRFGVDLSFRDVTLSITVIGFKLNAPLRQQVAQNHTLTATTINQCVSVWVFCVCVCVLMCVYLSKKCQC